jgi:3-dehydroquinate synthase
MMVQSWPRMTTSHVIQQQFSVSYSFPVIFTRGVFDSENPVLAQTLVRLEEPGPRRVLAYLDAGVARAFPGLAGQVTNYALAQAGAMDLLAPPHVVEGGEAIKNDLPGFVGRLDELVDQRMCRHSVVLAVGGGALLDAIGLAAALVHRGLRLVRIPTTVLAQNDSGVGVKNAINYRQTKNLLGVFAPPFAVINDLNFLRSLPDAEWTDGIAEAFKVALIKDREFFDWLCAHTAALRAREESAMAHLVQRCAELHLEHIRSGGDPFEFGQARPLDFGHWSAHRLETISRYTLSHGRAVAIGLALDAWYAVLNRWLDVASFEALYQGLSEVGFELWHEGLEQMGEQGAWLLLDGLREFREHLGGHLCVTMPRGVGSKFEIHDMSHEQIRAAVHKLKEKARSRRERS